MKGKYIHLFFSLLHFDTNYIVENLNTLIEFLVQYETHPCKLITEQWCCRIGEKMRKVWKFHLPWINPFKGKKGQQHGWPNHPAVPHFRGSTRVLYFSSFSGTEHLHLLCHIRHQHKEWSPGLARTYLVRMMGKVCEIIV